MRHSQTYGVGVVAAPLLVGGVVVAGAEVDGCWVVVLGVVVGVLDVVGGLVVSVEVDGVSLGDTCVSSVPVVVGVVDGAGSLLPEPPPKILPMLAPVPPATLPPVAASTPTTARIATANATTLVPMINGQRSLRSRADSREGSSGGLASCTVGWSVMGTSGPA
jgi:hypothetical protein